MATDVITTNPLQANHDFVCHSSDTQFQVGENLNYLI